MFDKIKERIEKMKAINWYSQVWKEKIALGDKSDIKIVIGEKVYTPAQLLEEMKKGTPIGLKHLEIIKRYLKWKREREVVGK